MMTSSKWKQFPRYWPFVPGIHRSPVNSPHKGQWRRAFMFSLICAWTNDWVNNLEAGVLRRRCAHYDVIVMWTCLDKYSHSSLSAVFEKHAIISFYVVWKSFWKCLQTVTNVGYISLMDQCVNLWPWSDHHWFFFIQNSSSSQQQFLLPCEISSGDLNTKLHKTSPWYDDAIFSSDTVATFCFNVSVMLASSITQTPVSGSCGLPLGALQSMWVTWCKI